jgi:hypothetical protein
MEWQIMKQKQMSKQEKLVLVENVVRESGEGGCTVAHVVKHTGLSKSYCWRLLQHLTACQYINRIRKHLTDDIYSIKYTHYQKSFGWLDLDDVDDLIACSICGEYTTHETCAMCREQQRVDGNG